MFVVVWLCFCDGVVVFLCFCCEVVARLCFVAVWLCFCGGVVVFLCFRGCVFVVAWWGFWVVWLSPKAAAKGSFEKSVVIKHRHQTLLKFNIVIKHCLKFCGSDGCLKRASSKTAQSSSDCYQRLPKVLLK